MRYFVTFLIGIGLVVLVIILLIRAIFGGGGGTPEEQPAPLLDYANTNVIMRLTISGPIRANQEHYQANIDISQYSNDIRTIQGYEGRVKQSKTYTSNPNGYANFLRALDLMGYTMGNESEEADNDERGYCPFGKRYTYEIIDGGTVVQRFWSTSCGDEQGTFLGEADSVIKLYEAQIPDYSDIVSGLSL